MQYTPEQQAYIAAAVAVANEGGVATFSGAAGTGKTTCMKEIKSRLGAGVAVCTPTNKAARVLMSKGVEAQTLHSRFLLPTTWYNTPEGRLNEVAAIELATRLLTDEANSIVAKGSKASLQSILDVLVDQKLSSWNPRMEWSVREADEDGGVSVLMIDEASMVGGEMMTLIEQVRAIHGCSVLMFGDEFQLPPVMDTDYFGASKHRATLRTVMRQAEGNPALAAATRIREVRGPVNLSSFGGAGFDLLDEVRKGAPIITLRNTTRVSANLTLRRKLGMAGMTPVPGDRLLLESRGPSGLSNGEFVEVVEVVDQGLVIVRDDRDREIPVSPSFKAYWSEPGKFGLTQEQADELRLWDMDAAGAYTDAVGDLSTPESVKRAQLWQEAWKVRPRTFFGYAITCHKSQGSEWPNVVICDETWGAEDQWRWQYTALTRVRERAVVVPGGRALATWLSRL